MKDRSILRFKNISDLMEYLCVLLKDMNGDETNQGVDKLDFTSEGETLGYISLDQAQVLALRLAQRDTSVYGDRYSETMFAWEVTSAEDGEDYYQIRISFHPVQGFSGEPGTELLAIDKMGTLEFRQVITFPVEKRRLPTGLIAVGGLGGIGAVIGLFFAAGIFSSDVTGAANGRSELSLPVVQTLVIEESEDCR